MQNTTSTHPKTSFTTTLRADFFKTFTKFELPLFRDQILQYLHHCNTRVGGWEHPQSLSMSFASSYLIVLSHFAQASYLQICLIGCVVPHSHFVS